MSQLHTSMHLRRLLATIAALALLGSLLVIAPGTVAASAGTARTVARAGSGSITTGHFTPTDGSLVLEDEFAGEGGDEDAGPDPFDGSISLSDGSVKHGVSVNSAARAKSNPTFKFGFEGLNHYQQRYSRGGNQFSVEPPDQGMCAGNGFILETVNDVMNVFHQSDGTSALPDNTATNIVAGFPRNVNHAVDLNSFYGYPPAITRATGVRGEFVTDPTCLYDAQTNRWFNVVLTLNSQASGPCQGVFSCVNHLDIAVSTSGDPTGTWNIYKLDVTNDGTNTGGVNAGPYLGDYPHIGADANGFYVTTNAYPWHANGFSGAQIYAFSKAALAAGASSVNVTHIDSSGAVPLASDAGSSQPGFTLWPAQSPGTGSFATGNGGTEYFLSSNAADEAQKPVAGTAGTRSSDKIILWSLTNTSSLNSASPALSLGVKVIGVDTYGVPPKQQQPGSGSAPGIDVPQGHCINDTTTPTIAGVGCWRLLFVGEPAHTEVVSRPDSNDSRMQQVMYSNGKVWGSLDTAVNPDGGPQRAGIAWYIVNPNASSLVNSGTLGASGYDFTYPAIGVTAAGRGVMAFTATGDTLYPSAGYASIDASNGVGAWNVVPGGQGAAPDDGFTSYKSQVGNPPRTRWGDYGAAAVVGNSVWIASEYIGHACDYSTWGGRFFSATTGDNLLGTCATDVGDPGTRSALANWSTFISKFTP
jgi:hypothetical protein